MMVSYREYDIYNVSYVRTYNFLLVVIALYSTVRLDL